MHQLGIVEQLQVSSKNIVWLLISLDIVTEKPVSASEHTDIVKCIVACESRFYSAGYDGRMVIYDTPHHGNQTLHN
jgi:hypothetical protein